MQKDNKSGHNFLSLDVVKSRFEVGPDLAKWLQPPSNPTLLDRLAVTKVGHQLIC